MVIVVCKVDSKGAASDCSSGARSGPRLYDKAFQQSAEAYARGERYQPVLPADSAHPVDAMTIMYYRLENGRYGIDVDQPATEFPPNWFKRTHNNQFVRLACTLFADGFVSECRDDRSDASPELTSTFMRSKALSRRLEFTKDGTRLPLTAYPYHLTIRTSIRLH